MKSIAEIHHALIQLLDQQHEVISELANHFGMQADELRNSAVVAAAVLSGQIATEGDKAVVASAPELDDEIKEKIKDQRAERIAVLKSKIADGTAATDEKEELRELEGSN